VVDGWVVVEEKQRWTEDNPTVENEKEEEEVLLVV
jgi:hypothetical protein